MEMESQERMARPGRRCSAAVARRRPDVRRARAPLGAVLQPGQDGREAEHEVRWRMRIRDRTRMPWRKSDQVQGKAAKDADRDRLSGVKVPPGPHSACYVPLLLHPLGSLPG